MQRDLARAAKEARLRLVVMALGNLLHAPGTQREKRLKILRR